MDGVNGDEVSNNSFCLAVPESRFLTSVSPYFDCSWWTCGTSTSWLEPKVRENIQQKYEVIYSYDCCLGSWNRHHAIVVTPVSELVIVE